MHGYYVFILTVTELVTYKNAEIQRCVRYSVLKYLRLYGQVSSEVTRQGCLSGSRSSVCSNNGDSCSQAVLSVTMLGYDTHKETMNAA